jgi:hypothetical protein
MKNGWPVRRDTMAWTRSQLTLSPAINVSLSKPLSGSLPISPPALNTSMP